MFEDSLLESEFRKTRARKKVAISFATALELAMLGLLALFPFAHVAALPESIERAQFIPLPPAGAAPAARAAAPRPAPHQITLADLNNAPVKIPKYVRRVIDTAQSISLAPPGLVPCSIQGVPGGLGAAGMLLNKAVIPAPLPSAQVSRKPLRVSNGVQSAKLIYGPEPVYPQIARLTRIQGTVRLEAIIDKVGDVRALKVVEGNPLLIRAALDAVSRWRYQPTLLNGQAVEIETEIDVVFTLGD